jgi:hypothetical protein
MRRFCISNIIFVLSLFSLYGSDDIAGLWYAWWENTPDAAKRSNILFNDDLIPPGNQSHSFLNNKIVRIIIFY